MFYHASDIKVTKVVQRLEMNVGELRRRSARRVKVPGSITHVSS